MKHRWHATGEFVDKAYDATCERCRLRRRRAPHHWNFDLEWADGTKRRYCTKTPPCPSLTRENVY
ncbi:MAG: hypothetical protein KAI25_14870 [Hyphomicrobiaceae bacterium]|nr:hypothetical protein [Hyphomicrobiaceae bacterium]